jgi:hypothetical protein
MRAIHRTRKLNPMTVVLSNQIDATRKSADQLESQLGHELRGAMFCYDVQDLAAGIVRLYHDIGRHVHHWQDYIAEGKNPAELPELAAMESGWFTLYSDLQACATKVTCLIKSIEAVGYPVEGKEQFKEAVQGLREITCFSLERVRDGKASIAAGNGVELDRFFDSLQGHSLT